LHNASVKFAFLKLRGYVHKGKNECGTFLAEQLYWGKNCSVNIFKMPN